MSNDIIIMFMFTFTSLWTQCIRNGLWSVMKNRIKIDNTTHKIPDAIRLCQRKALRNRMNVICGKVLSQTHRWRNKKFWDTDLNIDDVLAEQQLCMTMHKRHIWWNSYVNCLKCNPIIRKYLMFFFLIIFVYYGYVNKKKNVKKKKN